MKLETVQIKDDNAPGGYVEINKSDYEGQEIYGAEKPKKKAAPKKVKSTSKKGE